MWTKQSPVSSSLFLAPADISAILWINLLRQYGQNLTLYRSNQLKFSTSTFFTLNKLISAAHLLVMYELRRNSHCNLSRISCVIKKLCVNPHAAECINERKFPKNVLNLYLEIVNSCLRTACNSNIRLWRFLFLIITYNIGAKLKAYST